MHIQNYLNGEWVPAVSGATIPNINPATGQVYGTIPNSDAADVELAVEAAEKAFPAWASMNAEKRFGLLEEIARGIESRLDELALAETTDNGKPLWLSKRMDIPRAASNFRFFAAALLHFASESHTQTGAALNYTLRQPIGIVGCISPWNLPLYLFSWKIAPALAAGNCVIAKPSEVTPATAYLLAQICEEAGMPPGVLNILHGTGASCGEAIVKHPKIKAISFTGSTRAGAQIAGIAAPMFKKLSLELGGKNAALIFADCDLNNAVAETLRSSFTNQGQICLCTSRILVERSVYPAFKERFLSALQQWIVGDPLEETSKQGAIVSDTHFQKIRSCIERAKTEGGVLLTGGKAVTLPGRCSNGYFIEPTVFEGPGPDSATNQEEIFGPVVTLQVFDSEAEAVELANNSQYGLAATIWSNSLNRVNRVSAALQTGIVWVNCWLERDLRTPFGGMKQSGVGREGGWEAMRFFTEPRNICISNTASS